MGDRFVSESNVDVDQGAKLILVKISTCEERNGALDVLEERHVMANTPGGALNSIARDPARGAIFKVVIIDRDAEDPVYDHA